MTLRCGACGFDNPAASRFCGSCGERLVRLCPICGAVADPDFRFCNACGTPLAEAPATEAPPRQAPGSSARNPPPTAERRLVSVLFVDLVGFTRIAESLDPEEARDLLGRYYDTARLIVGRFDGAIEKFIGDAVMAVWGAPIAHEDDAQRAVRAGLELVGAVTALGAELGHPLAARGAVATGEAAVTLGAEGQGMVAGDLVNTCSRIQSSARAGTLLADGTTRQAARRAINFKPAADRKLKGKSLSVPLWRAIGPAEPGRRAAAHQGPFVGRDPELSTLLEIAQVTAIDPRSRLVSIIGIAGIGKSRLAWELERRVAERLPSFSWHVGRATGYGEGSAFAPLAEIVRRVLGVAERLEPEEARRQVEEGLARIVSEKGDRDWLTPRLVALLAAGSPVSGTRDELFAAWRRLLERAAERSPLVLVLEDVQWAHDELLDFIEYLAEWSRHHAMLIITLARPELLDLRPGWGAGLRSFTAMHLGRLGDDPMDQLLAGLVPDLPAPATRAIRQRADGVPLYAVEMVRMLQDSGRLADQALALSGSDVPSTLHALIAARIDALPPPDRAILLSASVLGQRFRRSPLEAVSGVEADALSRHLRTLVRREFLVPHEDDVAASTGHLSFVQSLVRDICYRTLSRRERRARHLAAAAHFESSGDEAVESVAEHLVAALEAGRDEGDPEGIIERARVAQLRAAQKASAMLAHGQALDHFERALGLAPGGGDRAAVLEEAAAEARSAARFETAERYLREAVGLRQAQGQRAGAARDRAQLAGVLLLAQRNETALAELEGAWAQIADLEPDVAMAELAAQLARAHLLQGRHVEAVAWSERATDLSNRAGAADVVTDALITRGSARLSQGDEAGLDDLRRAIEEAAAGGHLQVELRARNNLAWLVMGDDPHATADSARRGMELAQSVGARDMVLQLLSVSSAAAIDTGDWAWAADALREATEEEMPEAYRLETAIAASILAALRGEESPDRVITSQEPIDPQTDPQLLGGLDYARAWVAFLKGDQRAALDLARRSAEQGLGMERFNALALATRSAIWLMDVVAAEIALSELDGLRLNGRAVEATRLTLRAGVAALMDDGATSDELYDEATRRWRQLRLPLQLVLCLLERDRFSPSSAERADAAAAGAGEAAEILAGLGARALQALQRRSPEAA